MEDPPTFWNQFTMVIVNILDRRLWQTADGCMSLFLILMIYLPLKLECFWCTTHSRSFRFKLVFCAFWLWQKHLWIEGLGPKLLQIGHSDILIIIVFVERIFYIHPLLQFAGTCTCMCSTCIWVNIWRCKPSSSQQQLYLLWCLGNKNNKKYLILLISQGEICKKNSSPTALLRSEGHTVEFVKTPDRDEVELVVHGETIYWCKIQDLQYGELPNRG